MSSPATQTAPFPQRALLLGVTWLPATFLLLWVCLELGWWSSSHMEPALAILFAALFLAAFLLQAGTVLRAAIRPADLCCAYVIPPS